MSTHWALGSSMSSKGKVGLAGVVTPWLSTVTGRSRSSSILKMGSVLASFCFGMDLDWKVVLGRLVNDWWSTHHLQGWLLVYTQDMF